MPGPPDDDVTQPPTDAATRLAPSNGAPRTPDPGRFTPGAIVAGCYRLVALLGKGGTCLAWAPKAPATSASNNCRTSCALPAKCRTRTSAASTIWATPTAATRPGRAAVAGKR
ncbi:MAG: hypothetical protein HY048_05945 [Acidobacteria bacterium]|nr:hypothetical protein [Acidobacteriota bacterium]